MLCSSVAGGLDARSCSHISTEHKIIPYPVAMDNFLILFTDIA
jgi:hypothetical protein